MIHIDGLPERILRKIEPNENGCWIWTGNTRKGYGQVLFNRKNKSVHRLTYETMVGAIPHELELDHLCRTMTCCNPAHLEAVTHHENTLRRSAAQTHCRRGHEFTPENTRIRTNGHRSCRKCCHGVYGKKSALVYWYGSQLSGLPCGAYRPISRLA